MKDHRSGTTFLISYFLYWQEKRFCTIIYIGGEYFVMKILKTYDDGLGKWKLSFEC